MTPQVYGSSSAILEDGGRWTLDKIKQLTAGGGSIEGQVEEITRRNIFRKELERSITDGEGRGRREVTDGEGRGRWKVRVGHREVGNIQRGEPSFTQPFILCPYAR